MFAHFVTSWSRVEMQSKPVFAEFINTDRFWRHVVNARVNIQAIFDRQAHALKVVQIWL